MELLEVLYAIFLFVLPIISLFYVVIMAKTLEEIRKNAQEIQTLLEKQTK